MSNMTGYVSHEGVDTGQTQESPAVGSEAFFLKALGPLRELLTESDTGAGRESIPALDVPSQLPMPCDLRGIEWFRAEHPELAWSNRKAGERVLIMVALASACFPVILDATLAFGLGKLYDAWVELRQEPSLRPWMVARVDQLLRNIHRGVTQAMEERDGQEAGRLETTMRNACVAEHASGKDDDSGQARTSTAVISGEGFVPVHDLTAEEKPGTGSESPPDQNSQKAILPDLPQRPAPSDLRGIEWFRARHPELAWSNRDAGKDILVLHALSTASFQTILDATVAFGYSEMRAAWEERRNEPSVPPRVVEWVDRIFRNIQRGLALSAEERCGEEGKSFGGDD